MKPCKMSDASLAQLAEHALRKRVVVGSIPAGGFVGLEGVLVAAFSCSTYLCGATLDRCNLWNSKLSLFERLCGCRPGDLLTRPRSPTTLVALARACLIDQNLSGVCLGSCLTGAARGNRTANRVSVSSGKNDLKRLAGSGFRGFNILEDVSYRNAPSGAGC